MASFIGWFTGGDNYSYMFQIMCRDGDYLLVNLNILSGVFIFVAYLSVALFFFQRYKQLRQTVMGRTMLYGALVFLFCGLTHFVSATIMPFWPGYRLETILRYVAASLTVIFIIYLKRKVPIDRILAINVSEVNKHDSHIRG